MHDYLIGRPNTLVFSSQHLRPSSLIDKTWNDTKHSQRSLGDRISGRKINRKWRIKTKTDVWWISWFKFKMWFSFKYLYSWFFSKYTVNFLPTKVVSQIYKLTITHIHSHMSTQRHNARCWVFAAVVHTCLSRDSSPRARTNPLVSIWPSLRTYRGRPSRRKEGNKTSIYTISHTIYIQWGCVWKG